MIFAIKIHPENPYIPSQYKSTCKRFLWVSVAIDTMIKPIYCIWHFTFFSDRVGGRLFGPHPRNLNKAYLVDLKFGIRNYWHKTIKNANIQKTGFSFLRYDDINLFFRRDD